MEWWRPGVEWFRQDWYWPVVITVLALNGGIFVYSCRVARWLRVLERQNDALHRWLNRTEDEKKALAFELERVRTNTVTVESGSAPAAQPEKSPA